MRRRELLHATAGAAGLSALGATALAAAGRDASPSRAEATTATATSTPSSATAGSTASSPTATRTDGSDGAGATDATGFGPLARIDVSSDAGRYQATEAVTTPDGRYAFVSKLDGFHVVDCADPGNPDVVATRDGIATSDGRTLGTFLDLKYDRGRLLLATGRGSEATGIALFDVRDPAAPRRYRTYETTYSIHNCDLHGEYAYLTTGQALDVVHVATDDPASVATWSVTDFDDAYGEVPRALRNLHDVYVQGGRAYLAYWDVGTWILDVSDPTAPEHVGHVADHSPDDLADLDRTAVFEYVYEPPGNAHYAQPNDDGDVLAVGAESWDVERGGLETDEPAESDAGGPSGVTLWDVADPANPARLATIEPPPVPDGENASRSDGYWTTAHNFDVVGDYLYSSWYRGGVKVHDISDPANPDELAHWANGDAASFWTARVGVPGEFFVATSLENPTDGTAPGGFYTFPDPTDDDATVTPAGPDDAIPSVAATSASAGTAPASTDGNSTIPDSTAAGDPATPVQTAAASDTAAPTPSATDRRETTSGDGSGFGLFATLAGLGVGAWRSGRDDD